MARMKVLIDTDPGVDDALAILMAHAHADVVALSIAAGNVGLHHTVANALKLVETIGAATPVFGGCAAPLVHPAEDAGFVHGKDGFGDTGYVPSARAAEAEHAAHALLRLSHENAGDLVVVAIAPLTNLALALQIDPTLPRRVPAEFNIGFDPEAAHVVFSSWPQFTLVDWEATMRHGIEFERMQRWLDADDPRARFFAAISRKTREWTRSRGRPRLLVADALAMAVALQPEIVLRAEEHHVAIELDGTLTRGATVVDWEDRVGAAANARIVLDVDQARFETVIAVALGIAE